MNDPDELAWQLFLALCRQALPGKAGEPDPTKPSIKEYDPDRPVVWETWALANGGRAGPVYQRPNRSEVFDVVGAGDTVIALMALGMAAGWEPRLLATVAQLGAGIVIQRLGNATTTIAELEEAAREWLPTAG